MGSLLELAKTPVPSLLVVGGLVFLLLALGGRISGHVDVPAPRQRYSGILGLLLILT